MLNSVEQDIITVHCDIESKILKNNSFLLYSFLLIKFNDC